VFYTDWYNSSVHGVVLQKRHSLSRGSEWLTKHLGQRKVVLVGHSWGTVVGEHMVFKRPDLFGVYRKIGCGDVDRTDLDGFIAKELDRIYYAPRTAPWDILSVLNGGKAEDALGPDMVAEDLPALGYNFPYHSSSSRALMITSRQQALRATISSVSRRRRKPSLSLIAQGISPP
jgi:pimeloyl-ACP methyl ester carboxylesterase